MNESAFLVFVFDLFFSTWSLNEAKRKTRLLYFLFLCPAPS